MTRPGNAPLVRPELLERAAARNLQDYVALYQWVDSETSAQAVDCCGGVASFTGADSPLTTIKGAGPEITDSEIDQTLAFYRSCGAARSTFELAAWVTPASVERLVRRGFHIAGAENVVFRHLPVETSVSPFPIAEWEASQWVDLMLIAWECPQTPAWRHLAQAAAHLPDAVNLGVSLDGIQACGQLVPSEDFAIFGCDATATASRGRGIQTALIQERLRHAVERGFSTAIAEVAPNSTSEHNYLRCGFRVAYTRTHYTLEIA